MPGKDNSILDNTINFLEDYIPAWFEKQELTNQKSPLFIFISGPQGSGKSYTTAFLYKYLLEKYGGSKKIASMSIDDFYLTHEDQKKFNKKFADNKLLQGRGLPGTHDITLLSRCLETILKGESDKLSLPHYDKSKFDGEGDRSDEKTVVGLPLDLIVFEGWFLGFNPRSYIPHEDLNKKSDPLFEEKPELKQIDANLQLYSKLLWNNPQINSLGIVFETDKLDNVYKWRQEQENALKQKTGCGMNDAEVKSFVDRYFPAYETYYQDMVLSESLGSVATLTLGVDLKRNVISRKERCIE